jgi:hypothetical protein
MIHVLFNFLPNAFALVVSTRTRHPNVVSLVLFFWLILVLVGLAFFKYS